MTGCYLKYEIKQLIKTVEFFSKYRGLFLSVQVTKLMVQAFR